MQTITITPGESVLPQLFIAAAIILGVMLLVVLFCKLLVRFNWLGLALPLCMLVLIVGVVASLMFFAISDEIDRDNRVVAALQAQLGYTHVQLDGSSFTASSDGMYVEGRVVHDQGDDYIVVIED